MSQVLAWTCEQVVEWLIENDFEEYAENFHENEIEGEQLLELTMDELKQELEIAKLGPRKKLYKAIQQLKGKLSPKISTTSPVKIKTTTSRVDLAVLHAAPLVLKDQMGNFHSMEKLDLRAERQSILGESLAALADKAIRVAFNTATTDALRAIITAWNSTALHFSGHGIGNTDVLCFEDGEGGTHMITPNLLREILRNNTARAPGDQSLQLVFVSSCHSEKAAQVFVEAGVPHVVAVQSDALVVDSAAKTFARHFYLALFLGYTVRDAFERGKGAVRSLPGEKCTTCCCAHLHEPDCKWLAAGARHGSHPKDRCCCKSTPFPHDESSKFLLLGSVDALVAYSPIPIDTHRISIFHDVEDGTLIDTTPPCVSNLPSEHGQFVGRNIETYNLVKSVKRNRVTVCVGAPGIGKSSLVIAAAHYVLERRIFPGGVYYIDVDGLQLGMVRYAIAQNVGIPAGESDEEVFAELGSRRCLVILDKVETLYEQNEDACQVFLGKLVSIASQTSVLIASRIAVHIPTVTAFTLSIKQLPVSSAIKLLKMTAPQCSTAQAEKIALMCGCLPLALRVTGRALANPRNSIDAETMISILTEEKGRFSNIQGLNNLGGIECVDSVIRSSYNMLDRPLRMAFIALGMFCSTFELKAVAAVLNNPADSPPRASRRPSLNSSSRSSSFGGRPRRDSDSFSIQSLGSHLYSIDDCTFDFDDAFMDSSYQLLDMQTEEEEIAKRVEVTPAHQALEQLNLYSLVEYDPKKDRYRQHNLIQLFAETECQHMFLRALSRENQEDQYGEQLYITWRRRFVRYCCLVVTHASQDFRMNGTLTSFDCERPNIESAMNIANELATFGLEKAREREARAQLDEGVNAKKSESAIPNYSTIVDTLLYANLLARGRFVCRARLAPRCRIEKYSLCLKLSREARVIHCSCGEAENSPNILLTDEFFCSDESRERCVSYKEKSPWEQSAEKKPVAHRIPCACPGVLELIAIEAILLAELGFAYQDTTDNDKAERMYLESLRLQEEVLGRTMHQQVAEVKNYLGICFGSQTSNPWLFRQAEKLLTTGLQMRRTLFDENHPEYATSLNNLANLYRNSLRLRRQKNTEETKLGFGGVLYRSIDEVESMYRESLRIREEALGDFHPQVAQSLNNLGILLSYKSNSIKRSQCPDEFKSSCQEIEDLYLRALKIRRKCLGNSNYETAATLNNIGNLKRILGQYAEAEQYFLESLQIREKFYQNENDRIAQTLMNLGNMTRAQEKFAVAESYYRRAAELRRALIPDTIEEVQALEILSKCIISQGREDEGKAILSRAKDIRAIIALKDAERHGGDNAGQPCKSVELHEANIEVPLLLSPEAGKNEKFNLVGRLLGKKGAYLKKIEKHSGAQVMLTLNPDTPDDPLPTIKVSATTSKAKDAALKQLIHHVEHVQKQWKQFNYGNRRPKVRPKKVHTPRRKSRTTNSLSLQDFMPTSS